MISAMGKRIERDASTAIAYVRVSTGKQELSLDAQRTAIEAWAASKGVKIAAWYQDQGVKGSTPLEQRPGLLSAMTGVAEHNAGLLVILRRDRIARDVLVAGLIDRAVESYGAQVHSIDGAGNGKSPTEVFTKTILDASSQLERAMIAARTKAALAEKKARGERLGRTPISELLPGETVELVKSLYNSGCYTHASLADELNRRGVPTATGNGKWWKRTVQQVLKIENTSAASIAVP